MAHAKVSDHSIETVQASQQLYLTLYEVTHYQLKYRNEVNFMERGKMFSSFCLILKGSVRFDTEAGPIYCGPGDFLYMPDDERYASHWTGDPDIEFISLFFRFAAGSIPDVWDNSPASQLPLEKRFAFQKLDALGDFSQQEDVEAILREWRSGNPQDRIMSISRMYRILAQAYPHLRQRTARDFPDSIRPAVEYIAQHREGNEKVAFYASLCHLSESRFYSLFSSHMRYTPIEYRNLLRAYQAGALLRDTSLSIEEISARLGFESPEYFRRIFKRYYKQSPSAFRKHMRSRPGPLNPAFADNAPQPSKRHPSS